MAPWEPDEDVAEEGLIAEAWPPFSPPSRVDRYLKTLEAANYDLMRQVAELEAENALLRERLRELTPKGELKP